MPSPATKQVLPEVFDRLKTILKCYQDTLSSKTESDREYDLWSLKDIEVGQKKRHEMNFATIIIQKNYVGFYFMPVYTDPKLLDDLSGELTRLLKGKSCFHIKSLDPAMENHVREALEKGYNLYKAKGWI